MALDVPEMKVQGTFDVLLWLTEMASRRAEIMPRSQLLSSQSLLRS